MASTQGNRVLNWGSRRQPMCPHRMVLEPGLVASRPVRAAPLEASRIGGGAP